MAQLIADKMAAMIISPHHNIVQDSCDDVLALTAPVQMAAPKVNVEFRGPRLQQWSDTSSSTSSYKWQHQLSPTCMVRMELWIHYNCREGQADQG